jgi:hypothetical protein
MRKLRTFAYYSFLLLLFYSCDQNKMTSQVEIKKLDYPSASAIEYYEGNLYIMGDDATNLVVLDTNLNVVGSLPVFFSAERRLPKETKPDLEASAVDANVILYLFGSGSAPHRNLAFEYDLKNKNNDSIKLEPLYAKIKANGIEQINIEGACFISGKLIMVNRGNKGYQHNQLIVIDDGFIKGDSAYLISILPFETQQDTASFKGISGLTYAAQNDRLVTTVSTEDTRNAYEDGTIGKSYLWIIDNMSNKLKAATLKPDKIIDLEEIDPRFRGQKIESATVIEETKDAIYLVLVADNDDGSSTIFKMSISTK